MMLEKEKIFAKVETWGMQWLSDLENAYTYPNSAAQPAMNEEAHCELNVIVVIARAS